ncbi:MAG: hypothetical protein QXO69_00090 [archaeon]
MILFGMIVVLAAIMLGAFSMSNHSGPSNAFKATGDELCTENGKPVVAMYSTTTCPHCNWAKSVFDRVAKEYEANGSIIAHHWQFDTGDDTLTAAVETSVPQNELGRYEKYNPSHTVPTFVLGCKYYRIGNSFESKNDTAAEEAYLREYINKLL